MQHMRAPTREEVKEGGTRACLQLAAVELDEAPVREEDLLPNDGGAQRRRALKPLLLQGRLRGLLLRQRGSVWPTAPDLWSCCPGLQPQANS